MQHGQHIAAVDVALRKARPQRNSLVVAAQCFVETLEILERHAAIVIGVGVIGIGSDQGVVLLQSLRELIIAEQAGRIIVACLGMARVFVEDALIGVRRFPVIAGHAQCDREIILHVQHVRP